MQDLVDEETQKIFQWDYSPKEPAAQVPVDGVLTENDKDTALLSLELPLPSIPARPPPHTLLITVVDRSGSMRSYWNSQVVPALNSLAQIAWDQLDMITPHIITYATQTSTISMSSRHQFQV